MFLPFLMCNLIITYDVLYLLDLVTQTVNNNIRRHQRLQIYFKPQLNEANVFATHTTWCCVMLYDITRFRTMLHDNAWPNITFLNV